MSSPASAAPAARNQRTSVLASAPTARCGSLRDDDHSDGVDVAGYEKVLTLVEKRRHA
jgi:hypothetical protein